MQVADIITSIHAFVWYIMNKLPCGDFPEFYMRWQPW